MRLYQFTEHFDFSVPPADPKLQIEKWDYPKSEWLVSYIVTIMMMIINIYMMSISMMMMTVSIIMIRRE